MRVGRFGLDAGSGATGVLAKTRRAAGREQALQGERPAIAAHVGPVDEPYAVVPCARGWADAHWNTLIMSIA